MPESSLRWGTRLGALGAALGVFAYLVGALLTPFRSRQTSAEAVLPVILTRGLFVLVALGLVLGLAYYAGMRVGREQSGQPGSTNTPTLDAGDRVPSVIAGGLVLLIYWLVTRFVDALVTFPPFERSSLSMQDLAGDFFVGLLFVCLGAGLGGIGARMALARKHAETVIVVSSPPPGGSAARVGVPPAEENPESSRAE